MSPLTHAAPRKVPPAQPAPPNTRVLRALNWLGENVNWVNQIQMEITQIPAPPFQEARRAAYLRKLLGGCGLRVRIDGTGNVVGERAGARTDEVVLLAAHLDTVFPAGTEVKVRREGGRILAPGISDNGTGLAALVAVAKALHEARVRTRMTLVFAADVGEEGEGNLRGMRKLVETYGSRLHGVIAMDGSSTDYVVTAALASRRVEAIVEGPGGHSWSDFGLPNPIDAIARGIARFIQVPVPGEPRTTFNIGEIEGGTAVNAIPHRAAIKVDLRSEQEDEIEKLAAALRQAMQEGVTQENSEARRNGRADGRSGKRLKLEFRVLGVRPGGELAKGSPLLAAVRAADEYLGNRSREERSSTDANIPLSMGIPAIALGAGGSSGGAHSLNEWYEPAGRQMGLRRVLLVLTGFAGVEP